MLSTYRNISKDCDYIPWERLRDADVLVTGASGLIASGVVEGLLAASSEMSLGTRVWALCRNRNKAKERFRDALTGEEASEQGGLRLLIGDVCDPVDSWEGARAISAEGAPAHFDYVIHAASSAHPAAFNKTPVDVMRANLVGTMNLLERLRTQEGAPRFLYVSSSEVYGENSEGTDVYTEDMPGTVDFARFRACYPESKRASETMCFSYKQQYGSDVVIVRPAFVYGREIIDSNARADVSFMRSALAGEDIVMYSAGAQQRSYCYITDCVKGILTALLKGESGGVYNIGDPSCVVSLHDYAQCMADAAGVRLVVDADAAPSGTVFLKTTRMVLSTDRLQALGWRPEVTLEQGMADIFQKDTKGARAISTEGAR